jgi:5'(3')-deoxyribonucleotidase
MNPLRVLGIDIDGVLANSDAGWTNYFAQRNCGRDHAARPTTWEWDCWKNLCSKCWDHVLHAPDEITNLPLMDGARAALWTLVPHFRLIAVTSRSPKDAPHTKAWLEHNILAGFFETVIHFDDKRSILEHYDAIAHIDDAPGKIESLYGSKVMPIIFDAPYNTHVKGLRAYGWHDAVDILLHPTQGLGSGSGSLSKS